MTREQKGRYLPPKDEIGPYFPGGGDFRLLFLNANPYNMGIANLGWQAVVEYILAACPFVSIQVEYADTIESANLNPLDFDLIVMHIPFEINYAVAIKMLNQIGLPLMSGERDNSLPMIIAGGVYNPLPLADFIDVFVLGYGRLPMVKLINLCFSEQGNKQKIIGAALGSNFEGVFIPDFNNTQRF